MIEAPHARLPGRAEHLLPGRFGDPDADGREPCLGQRALPGIPEALQTVFAKQGMKAEPSFALAGSTRLRRRLDPEQALVGERLEAGDEIDAEIAVGIGDRGCHVGRPAAGEDRKPGEEPAFLDGQQLVAPVEGAAQRALAFGRVAWPGPQVEAAAEPVEDRGGAEQADPGRRELDRQGEAIQASADLRDGSQRLTGRGEVRPLRSRAVDEQRDGPLAVQRRDRVPAFAGDPQQLAAGHQRPQAGSRPDQSRHDLGGRGEQLLEVVQDEEDGPLPEVGAQGLARRPVGRFADVEGDRDGRLQEVRIPKRGEVDEPDAMREQVASTSCDGEGEPGLAAAARPRQA